MPEAQTAHQPTLPPGTWLIDADHSNVEFVARHLLSRVRGRFADFGGAVTVAAVPEQSSVEVTIQAASINTNHEERDTHLRSADFLDVGQYPTLTFRSTSMAPVGAQGDNTFRLTGALTIRDVTKPIELTVEYLGWSADPWGNTRASFSARTEIDRDDFGATWNVVLESGGLLVGRKVQIELEIEALLEK